MKVNFVMIKKDGKMTTLKSNEFKDALAILPDGNYWGTIETAYDKMTAKQRRSIFGIAYKILQQCFIEATGDHVTIEWVHEFCENPDNGIIPMDYIERIKEIWDNEPRHKVANISTGEVIILKFQPTITLMTTLDEMNYYRNMQKFADEWFGADIPDPDSKLAKQTLAIGG